MQQNRNGDQRGHGGKHPDVPHPSDQVRGELRADDKAGKITGHDNAGRGGGKPLQRGPHTQQGRLQAVADHHQSHARQNRPAIVDGHKQWIPGEGTQTERAFGSGFQKGHVDSNLETFKRNHSVIGTDSGPLISV